MTLLLFGSERCCACHKAKDDLKDVPDVQYLDVNKYGNMAMKYKVMGLPTMVLVDEDKSEVRRWTYYSPNVTKEISAVLQP